jgi:hypothetical protein
MYVYIHICINTAVLQEEVCGKQTACSALQVQEIANNICIYIYEYTRYMYNKKQIKINH